MEPAAINAGCFEPRSRFLRGVREWTKANGVVLIFDEVITGFRMAPGGAQARYGVDARHHGARQGARRRHADQRRLR